MIDPFKVYFDAIKELDIKDATEHTLRSALENLLNSIAKARKADIRVIHEPKKDKSGKGAPDFKFKVNEAILGYLENKKIEENLDQILKSAQITKYKQLSSNIIITNYLEWVWLHDGNILARETLCYQNDVGNRRAKLDPEKAKKVGQLIEHFYSTPPKEIGHAKELALALATRCHDLRDVLLEELLRQQKEHQEERLWGLYDIFKREVFHKLEVREFADAFAQTLAYGLFLARLNMHNNPAKITLDNAKRYIPAGFELIRELVSFLDELEKEQYLLAKQPVDEILSIMNTLDLPTIHEDLAFTKRQDRLFKETEEERLLFAKDPYVYFYEDFLKAYDKETRLKRGVFYTPPPVVNFIVRAVNDILKDTFGISKGLADRKEVTVLDFATGTGTFLIEILQQIFEDVSEGIRDQIIEQHILKNLYGFEYLIAPYTIAHLKLSQFLRDKGYEMKLKERLQIYLTNTLEPISPQTNWLLPALSKEAEQAQGIKDKPILVIVGNPPYNVKSKNTGEWITRLLKKAYFQVDGMPLNEKNPKNLLDDYVKFIRFAQWKMEQVDQGVVGIITNHSFLDNPTFRGMRQSLMKSFNQIYVLDLHGNVKKQETTLNSEDVNVFDIEQGVAISLFIKKKGIEQKIMRGDLWGAREVKYRTLLEADITSLEWETLTPDSPHYFFTSQDKKLRGEYNKFQSITDIFINYSSGIKTSNDGLLVGFDSTVLSKKLKGSIDNFDVRKIKNILYRSLDNRVIYYDTDLVARARESLMKHMLDKENTGIIFTRQIVGGKFNHALVSSSLVCHGTFYLGNKGQDYLAPLYLYHFQDDKKSKATLFDGTDDGKERVENFVPAFRAFINDKYSKHYDPEQILGYIYAVLHSPTYRRKYIEDLRIDFPRIPFVDDIKTFEELSTLGWQLIQTHLLKDIPTALKVDITKGTRLVEDSVYDENQQRLYINRDQYFSPVPKGVWEFHIGGYQVLDKYLKSRKGYELTLDEIESVQNIIKVLAFTTTQMQKIDGIWKP